MNSDEFKHMVKSSILEAVNDLFRSDDEMFWKMFDNAVVGSFENGAYDIFVSPHSEKGKGLFLAFTGLDDGFFNVPFRQKMDDVCNYFEMSPDEKDAVISDLEYALERVKETPAVED